MLDWTLLYEEFDPAQEPLREALCTLGNGYFATRGAAEEASADDMHYPGTYLAGGYNRLQTEIAGQLIENEDLVNMPNWICLTFRPEDGDWFDIKTIQLVSYSQTLALKRGTLTRTLRFHDAQGRTTTLASCRFVHMGDAHVAGIRVTLTAENWGGRITLRSALDGRVVNAGVKRYQRLNSRHLKALQSGGEGADGVHVVVQTTQSHLQVAEAARTQVFSNNQQVSVRRRTIEEQGFIAQELDVDVAKGEPITIEKIATLYTSRDRAISECSLAARTAIQRVGRFDELLRAHALAWERLWSQCDIELEGDQQTQLLLRLHLFHLLQTVSIHTIDLDVGVPARGLHGEAYRGHIFWDELFIFPTLNWRLPELSRALLLYRYRRLPEARWAAQQAGYKGAMYPWQSGSSGREESQLLHLNPKSGRWVPDHTHLQRHVSAAIAYNIWQYHQATGDLEFLSLYGTEMLLEIARFWASLTTYNRDLDRYEIRGVMGPDEYHDGYPWTDEPGLHNNAYTNIMAVWTVQCSLKALDLLAPDRYRELCEALVLRDEELVRWREITQKMRVTFHGDGIISQFEGYEALEEFDWDGYRRKYGNIQRLDRILELEGDSANRYKVSKQADVLMLFYLFSADELGALFKQLGYPFESETIPNSVDYYLQRTSHGSTLSHLVHSWVLARADRAQSWRLFTEALESDVNDIQGGTTPEGIHLGAMAGTVDLVQRCYTGIEMRDEVLWLNPYLPEDLCGLAFSIRYRNHWLRLEITHDVLRVAFCKGWAKSARVGFRNAVYEFAPGDMREFSL
jgi:alpha,alpha-trehalase